MNNFGRFSQAKICFFIHKGGVFVLHQSLKVLVKLFQKLAGLGSAHKNGVFFLPSFFFAPLVPKKKRDCGFYVFFVGKGNFLKEVFLSPHPYPSRTLKLGGSFFAVITAFDGQTHNVRTKLNGRGVPWRFCFYRNILFSHIDKKLLNVRFLHIFTIILVRLNIFTEK